MEDLPLEIEEKIEQLPILPFEINEEFQELMFSDLFSDIFNFYKENYLPDTLKTKSEIYQRISLYLNLTGQGDKFTEETDKLLWRRPCPDIHTFLADKFYMGYNNSTLYPFWREKLEYMFRDSSPVRKAIFSGCIGCLTDDTVIVTLNGEKTIKELLNNFENEWVLSYNTSNNSWEPDKIIDVFYTGNRDIYEIELDNGEKIKCTSNHKFLTRKNKWVSIDNGLTPGLSMIPHYKEINQAADYKIKSITYIGKEDVYDITTEKNHNFALKAGIVAHNSGKSTVARKAFVYVLYRLLCLRYPRSVLNIDQDATIANVVIATTLKQVYEVNILPFIKLMETMPCFQRVMSQRSFENFNLEDPLCPIAFYFEKSSGTIHFPDNIILTSASQPTHFTGMNVINSFCFTETTKVYTNVGTTTFASLLTRFNRKEKIYTYTIDKNGNKEKSLITDVKVTGYKTDLIRIYYEDDRYIECTPEHPFVISNPKENDKRVIYENGIPYKQAQYLTEEDEIVSEKHAFVYELIDNRPDSAYFNKPFYIGISTHDNTLVKSHSVKFLRPYSHFTNKSLKNEANLIKKSIITKILTAGLKPKINIIKENLTLQEAYTLEKELINKYGKRYDNSGILANISSGGEGIILTTPDIIKRKSENIKKTKAKIRAQKIAEKQQEWDTLISSISGRLAIMIVCLQYIDTARKRYQQGANSPHKKEVSRQNMIKYNKSEEHRKLTAYYNSIHPKVSSKESREKLSKSQKEAWRRKPIEEKRKASIRRSLTNAWNVLQKIEGNKINSKIFNAHRIPKTMHSRTDPRWETLVKKIGSVEKFLDMVNKKYGKRFIYED